MSRQTGLGKVSWRSLLGAAALTALCAAPALASEADIKLPDLGAVMFFGGAIRGVVLLWLGLIVCAIGLAFGLFQYAQIDKAPAHKSMQDVSEIIWETCKTYLFQQGKFLAMLWILIGACMAYYFGKLSGMSVLNVGVILLSSIVGILGSYGVAWFGIRINTKANSRSAFAALKPKTGALDALLVPMKSGMSVGLLLVCVELFFMIVILTLLPLDLVGPCFIGFAIGESLGASALRIAGGIFTKIADIGSDLMKIVFNLPEDDPKNPGVIADCTGDNAGDSVGPTADGFETYGVTGVALVSFLALALAGPEQQAACGTLIIWIFVMRVLMIVTSLISYFINDVLTKSLYGDGKEFDPEKPLTHLVIITSVVSIVITYVASAVLLPASEFGNLWWVLSTIISCGTIAGALIPEFVKFFTSTNSRHVKEVVTCSEQGGASLNILSGFVAGNFSAFWLGLLMMILMVVAYLISGNADLMKLMPAEYPFAAPIFAFGLVAFGFLGMGPVTIAVDCFGPVSDNAQSVYELSQIEAIPEISSKIEAEFGFKPDFENAKLNLEKNDGAGNTFKATAKPVLIGTAVVGATTMVFGIILLLQHALKPIFGDVVTKLSLVQPEIIFGLMLGGAVIYWFTGAATQAVVTGSYRAVVYIKEHMKLDASTASIKDSKEVVKICTMYAQKGMLNIFIVLFCSSLAIPLIDPYLFIGYLISIAFFGLYQAVFMANAGGAWDNAKKIVEVDLRAKNTPLHAAAVIGDTVGDPFKDTSSVALNPVIKFTTLFGLLAVEIAVSMILAEKAGTGSPAVRYAIAAVLAVIALVFVYRSFFAMRIPVEAPAGKKA
ncbi:TPA: sodium-translocating pyrophosphatase [Candidatus Sumerlaeota bacterium]|jgi:K(+)-stimulated pyrophosphate-energized sodium pump|nr:sodium-translocating pyrophosphatase [Candidatus Sumerlaeota bacterium]